MVSASLGQLIIQSFLPGSKGNVHIPLMGPERKGKSKGEVPVKAKDAHNTSTT
jgi:hypothetical protein